MARLKLSLLGSFQVLLDGEILDTFAYNKVRALLAYLAAESGRPQPREALADLLWPGWPQESALRNLSSALANLRKAIGDRDAHPSFLLISRDSLQLDRQSDIWVDAWEFDGKAKNPYADIDVLESTAGFYRGNFLEGFSLPDSAPFEEWLAAQRENYQRRMLRLLNELAKSYESRQEYEQALVHARRQLELEPWLEEAHQHIMRLLALSGQRGAALAQFQACHNALQDALGVEPGAETTALYEQVRDGRLEELRVREVKDDLRAHQPVPIVPASPFFRTTNLPAPVSKLVGRQTELGQLCDLLKNPDCRLVTVLGAGGSGKTRLALEAGYSLLPLFADGVFWVAMDTFQVDRSLAPLVCAALDVRLNPTSGSLGESGRVDLQDELIVYLRNKQLLLVLDGFEGMLPEADLLASLLRGAPQLKILVTSRLRLNIQSEYFFPLGGLDYPADLDDRGDIHQFSALQLFEQAARRSLRSFELLPTSQAAVVEICRLLEGLPLGILLAASWASTLTPEQILGEMQRSLDILSTDWRDLPGRQHSLTATFDYSFSLLPEHEQTAFLRLSVFHNPFTSARAAQVAGVSILSLKRLVDGSLLQRTEENRFHMHDLLRQYALEKLVDNPGQDWEVHQKHCQVFLEALSAWETPLKSPRQQATLDEMNLEYADLLAAWDWCLEKDQFSLLGKALEAFRYFHFLRNLFHERTVLCQKALTKMEMVGIDEHNLHLWLRLVNWYYDCLGDVGDYQQGLDWILQVEERLQHISFQPTEFSCELALLLLEKALALWILKGDLTLIQPLQERSLELVHECEDPYLISHITYVSSLWQESVHQRLKLDQSALEIQRSVGDPNLTAFILTSLGYDYMASGNYLQAIQILEELNTTRRQWNDFCPKANFILFKGNTLASAGQFLRSRAVLEEGLRSCELSEDLNFQNRQVLRQSLNDIFLSLGEYEAVLSDQVFAGDGMDESDRSNSDFNRGCAHLVFQHWDLAEQGLIQCLQSYGTSRDLFLKEKSLPLLGYISYRGGNPEPARQFLIRALENGLETGFYIVLCYSLAVISLILCEKGDLDDGAELYSVAFAHPAVQNSRFFQDAFGKYIEPLVSQLPPEVFQAAQERGRQQYRDEAAQEWLQRLRDEPGLLSGHSS